MEKLLTTEEIADILGFKEPEYAARLLKRERLGYKIGKRVFVKESEFEAFLERKRRS